MSGDTINLTYSRIATHRACPQKYNYSYVRGLESDRSQDHPVELLFGNWWHAIRAVDSIVRGIEAGTLLYMPERLGTAEGTSENPHLWSIELPTLEDLRENSKSNENALGDLVRKVWVKVRQWERSLTEEELALWVERLGATPYDRLRYTDERWKEAYKEANLLEEPLAVELPWSRSLPAVGGVESNATVHGYIDEVYRDTARNIIVVRDHKSNKTIENRSTVDEMMDSQLQMYAWGVTQWLKENSLPAPKAVAYDRVRMTHPKQPKLTLTGTLSKAVTDFDLTTYLEFSSGEDGKGVPYEGRKKDGSGAGIYTPEESVIKSLEAPQAKARWLIRQVTPLNRNIIISHLRSAVDSSQDIRRTLERVDSTREAGRNLSSNCKWCPFNSLCRAEMVGGSDGEYDLKDMGLTAKAESTR